MVLITVLAFYMYFYLFIYSCAKCLESIFTADIGINLFVCLFYICSLIYVCLCVCMLKYCLTLCVRPSRIRDRRNLTRAYDGHESVTHRVRQENTAVTNS